MLNEIFVLKPRPRSRGGTWGALGSQNFNFWNMVMWHIELMGIMGRIECKKMFCPRVKRVTFG